MEKTLKVLQAVFYIFAIAMTVMVMQEVKEDRFTEQITAIHNNLENRFQLLAKDYVTFRDFAVGPINELSKEKNYQTKEGRPYIWPDVLKRDTVK